MRKLIIILLIGLWGCAGKPAPMEPEIEIIEDRQPTEMSAEEVAENKDYIFRKVEGQENLDVMKKSVLLIKKDGRIVSIPIQQLWDFITQMRIRLYQTIQVYNYYIDRLVEIGEHPDLDIDLLEIPEKADIRWFIPIYR